MGLKSRLGDGIFSYMTSCLILCRRLFNMQTHHLKLLVVLGACWGELGRDAKLGGVARVLKVPSGFIYATINDLQ